LDKGIGVRDEGCLMVGGGCLMLGDEGLVMRDEGCLMVGGGCLMLGDEVLIMRVIDVECWVMRGR